jgi:hypothetical protein
VSERLVEIFVGLVLEQPRRGIKLFGRYVFRSNSKEGITREQGKENVADGEGRSHGERREGKRKK